jgi:nucleotide-binding universal stress UspA family protein
MATILCPTRGGQSSVPNQDRAIAMAKEQGARLIFLYISSVHFLDRVSRPVLVNVARELDHMGEFLLAMAQERATEAGVQAETVVRQGDFRQNLLDIVTEMNVDAIVVGRAARGTGITDEEFLAGLAEEINELGAEMLVVDEGQEVSHYRP